MHANRTVSVVIPAHDEEATIADVVGEFLGEPHVDEVLVVDNRCADRTAERARAAGARVVAESKPGYGAALLAGMDAAKGDVLVLVEADGSFRARDLGKLLAPLDVADLVMGSRTYKRLLEPGANMGFALRTGNKAMAKFLQLLWLRAGAPRFTDVGCTYRALHRATFVRIRPLLRETGPAFSPELMCAALQARCRVLEVPVAYGRRAGGASKHSDTFARQAKTAWRMLRTILRKRFRERSLPAATPARAAESRPDAR